MTFEQGRVLSGFAADNESATVCTDLGLEPLMQRMQDHKPELPPMCGAVDLATGRWRKAAPLPSTRFDVAPRQRTSVEVKQDATGVQLCKGTACTTLALPRRASTSDELGVSVDDDGRYALVGGRSLPSVWIFDAVTGQQRGTLDPREHRCFNGLEFLGDIVYAVLGTPKPGDADACVPPFEGVLYRITGQPIGPLTGVEPAEFSRIALGGGRYAVPDRGSNAVAIVDGQRGTAITVRIPGVECNDCSPFDAGDEGNAKPIAATLRGKLVAVSPKLLVVIDPATGTLEKQIRFPVCSKP